MSEIYACAQATDKRHVTSTLLGGSAKKLTSTGNYIGMPTVLNHANDDVLVTTSLGHQYIDDLASMNPGALVMTMKANEANNFHTPDDQLQARITMVEAMDDSYLFVITLTALQSLCLEAEVPLKVSELEFLHAKVDDHGWRYQRLKKFIESYKFPKLTMCTPITLLQKIKQVALIILADWTCTINGCMGSLDSLGLNRNFSQYYKKIPAAWIITQNSMTSLKPRLSLHLTNNSHIMHRDISISHTIKLCKAHGINIPNGNVIQILTTKGMCMLSHAGRWIETPNGKLMFTTTESPAPQAQWTEKAREHWNQFALLLGKLDTTWLFNGEPTLMTPRPQRQVKAEEFIHGLSHILSMPPSSLPHQDHTWSSDSSMIPATSGIGNNKSVTAAITGPQMIVMHLSRQNMCVLHGELVRLIMGLVLSINSSQNNKLFTDNLNSVRFIDDTKTSINQENHLRNMNGRSYYRWIMNLAHRVRMGVIHMKAHVNQVNLSSLLNNRGIHSRLKQPFERQFEKQFEKCNVGSGTSAIQYRSQTISNHFSGLTLARLVNLVGL